MPLANPGSARTPMQESRRERALLVLRLEIQAISNLQIRIGAAFDRAIDLILACQGMVVVTGMGKAGLVGQKISATLASTGTPSLFLHPAEAQHGDLGRLRRQDLLLALSNSGETQEIKAMIPAARRLGTPLVAVTESANSTLGRHADCVLELGPVPEACPLGLAPTASTSAMLALGDALAMVVLEERGFSKEDYARFHPAGSLGRRLMRVDELMRRGQELPLAPDTATVSEVLAVMTRTPGRPGAALLTDRSGRLSGIFTDGDLRRTIERSSGQLASEPISAHMGKQPKTIPPSALAEDAMRLLRDHKIDQLAIVDADHKPIGLLDIQDVLDLKG
jgi:arabinose-5-phosphate isomerase